MKNIISAVQPTGNLHIGNYLGSIVRWKSFQDKYNCIFPIVDLHAITAGLPERSEFRNNIYKTLSVYLATGLDPKKAIIFQQSAVPAHAELFWILSNVVQIGKLNRMIQFKDKSGKNKEKACLGLYSYPVLMAADIMLYNTDIVLVGEDQLQHIELTNDIIASFNHKYNEDVFQKVEPLLMRSTKRIMSLRNAENKMSKSDTSDMTRINLTDSEDFIRSKIMKAKTDRLDDIETDLENRPEVNNLLNIFAAFSGQEKKEIQKTFKNLGFKKFKEELTTIIIDNISPLSKEIKSYFEDKSYLETVLSDGASRANEHADARMKEVKHIVGMI